MITIDKLVLNNFMCITHADLDFSQGTNLIVGSNGQGKSAVLQAVTLCLLEEKRGDTYKEYVQLGKDHCSVSLEAHIKGEPFKINISIDRNSTTMDRNATYMGRSYTTPKEVSQLLESFDIQYYADIIMSMQGGVDITDLKPAKRAEYLQKLLNFDFSDKIELVKKQQADLKEKIDFNNNKIDFNTKSIDDRKKEIKELIPLTFTQSDIDDLNNKVALINDELEKITVRMTERDKLNSDKSTLMSTIFNEQKEIDKLKHDIDLINSNQTMIDTLNSKINEYNENNKTLQSEKAEFESSSGTLAETVATLTTELTGLKEKLATAQATKVEKFNLYKEATQNVANKKAELNHSQKHLDMIKLGTCPECGHTFNAEDTTKYTESLNNAQADVSKAESDLQTATLDYNSSDADVKSINSQISGKEAEIAKANSSITLAKSNASRVEQQISQNNSSVSRLTEQISSYASKMTDIPAIKSEIDKKTESLKSLNSQVAVVESELAKTSNLSNEYTEKSNELKQCQQTLTTYNNEVIQNNAIVQNNETVKNSIASMESQINECKANVESYRRQKTTYDEAINILNTVFPDWLILKTCQMLEKEMNNFVQVVFPSMAIKLYQNKRGVEFFYTTDKDSGRILTKENLLNAKMASGFEKAILSIAFKVSLCSAYGLRFAFMDEIDQAGTEENSEALFRAILANDLFDQLFVISHKSTVREAIHGIAPSLKTYYVDHGKFSVEEAN